MLAEDSAIRLPRPVTNEKGGQRPPFNWSCTFSGHKQARAVPRLRRRIGDGTPARDALARRQRNIAFHLLHKQVEGALRMRLDELKLPESVLVRFDVVAVLDFVEAID